MVSGAAGEMYGTLDAEPEAQRTVSRAELTAFFCVSSGEVSVPLRFTLITK